MWQNRSLYIRQVACCVDMCLDMLAMAHRIAILATSGSAPVPACNDLLVLSKAGEHELNVSGDIKIIDSMVVRACHLSNT